MWVRQLCCWLNLRKGCSTCVGTKLDCRSDLSVVLCRRSVLKYALTNDNVWLSWGIPVWLMGHYDPVTNFITCRVLYACVVIFENMYFCIPVILHTSEFSGLWKHQNNPAYTKGARVFRMLKLDTTWKKKKKMPVELVTYLLTPVCQQKSHKLNSFSTCSHQFASRNHTSWTCFLPAYTSLPAEITKSDQLTHFLPACTSFLAAITKTDN